MLRRNFIKVGTGLLSFSIANPYLYSQDNRRNSKAVIWLWLGGGISQIESFDPKPNAPSDITSINGFINNNGIDIGGMWKNLNTVTDKCNIVRSFSHTNPSHGQATHYVMTGVNNPDNSEKSPQLFPSYGSIISRTFGSNNPINGMPSYVRVNNIEYDGAAWLGTSQYNPYDSSGEGVDNLRSRIELNRFIDRKGLLDKLDANKSDWLDLRNQSSEMIIGNISKAFDTSNEDPRLKDRYGNTDIGNQLLLSRRLIENGSRFVTIHYGGWDMHSSIQKGMENRVPPIDTALTTLINDIYDRGMNEDVLIVVTSEFGRTYRLNKGNPAANDYSAGRDHWPSLTTLMTIGGEYDCGRIIGKSDKFAAYPDGQAFGPKDLTATILDHYKIDSRIQFTDQSGRPHYILENDAKNILV